MSRAQSGLMPVGLTVCAGIDQVPPRQDHHAVEEAEAEGRGGVDGGTDGHAALDQALDHRHHLLMHFVVQRKQCEQMRIADWQRHQPTMQSLMVSAAMQVPMRCEKPGTTDRRPHIRYASARQMDA